MSCLCQLHLYDCKVLADKVFSLLTKKLHNDTVLSTQCITVQCCTVQYSTVQYKVYSLTAQWTDQFSKS